MPRRRPRPRTLYGKTVAAIKHNPIKAATAVLVFFGAIYPAVKGIDWLNEATDTWQLATHPFVYYQIGVLDKKVGVVDAKVGAVDAKVGSIGSENQGILRDVQIDIANGKLTASNNNIAKWQFELGKATTPLEKQLIAKSLQDEQDTKSRLESQLKTLKTVKGNQ
jgi:hypothetical protein